MTSEEECLLVTNLDNNYFKATIWAVLNVPTKLKFCPICIKEFESLNVNAHTMCSVNLANLSACLKLCILTVTDQLACQE